VKADRYAGTGPRWAAGATLVYGPTCPGLTMAKIRPFTCKVPDPKPRPSATVTPGTHDSASAAVAPGWSGPGQLQSRAGAREQGQDAADGRFLAGGFGPREVRLEMAAVAAAVLLLDHVAGSGQAGDAAAGAALGDAQAGRDVAQLRARQRAMRSNARAWLARKLQLATPYELGYGF
jgi:hypothetical protein